MRLPSGPTRIVYINRAQLAGEEGFAPICVEEVGDWKNPVHAQGVRINGPSELVWNPDTPHKSGTRVWVETTSELVLDIP